MQDISNQQGGHNANGNQEGGKNMGIIEGTNGILGLALWR